MVEESVCGLCNASGNVVRSPATFARLLQALDLSKLPPVLTEHRQRIGLCIQCENQIKLLEEAASIRENLKETFVSHLHQLSGSETYSPLCTKPDLYPYRDSLQHSNEITPLHHSIKRKISNGGPIDLANRRKQLKTHITHTLPISPNSNSDPVQSDEENVLTIDEGSLGSPTSSRGGYTPPPAHSTKSSQVLSDLTGGRNRRKQARPAKATDGIAYTGPSDPRSNEEIQDIKRETQSQTEEQPVERKTSPRASPCPTTPATSPRPTSALPHTPGNPAPHIKLAESSSLTPHSAFLTPSSYTMSTESLCQAPFGAYQYQLMSNMIAQRNSKTSTTDASATTPQSSIPARSDVKSEVKDVMPGMGTMNLSGPVTADSHTLLKTDKRRYCKVCAASSRKANNGRPPQSRFLCVVCNKPMCRSCIEEHRYRVMMKLDDAEPDVKTPSASARLLHAVKMKETVSQSSPKLKPVAPKPSSMVTPPSNSSLIYGSPSAQTSNSSAVAAAAQLYMSQMAMPLLARGAFPLYFPGMSFQQPLPKAVDMRIPNNFQPIAPKREASGRTETPSPGVTASPGMTASPAPSRRSSFSGSVSGSTCSEACPESEISKSDNPVKTQTEAAVTDEVAEDTAGMLCIDEEPEMAPTTDLPSISKSSIPMTLTV